MKRASLLGLRFGRLTVISKAASIWDGNKIKRFWGAWNCQCDCGTTIVAKTAHLTKGQVQSCGCIVADGYTSINAGHKFGRLTTISYKEGKWFCLCECGEHIEIRSYQLTSGNTKSCGCLKTDVNMAKLDKLIAGKKRSINKA